MKACRRLLLWGVTFMAAIQVPNATPIMIMHKSDPDVPARLEWSSEPNAVYRIEYSVDLTTWILAEQEVPSQGTDTFWLDTGSTANLQPRTPSIDRNAPYRFYRVSVQRYTPNGGDISVTTPIALQGGTSDPNNHTVLGAWRYACVKTQPKEAGTAANMSRSAYWPECQGDFIYGYGPNMNPFGGHVQGELLEDDQAAPAP